MKNSIKVLFPILPSGFVHFIRYYYANIFKTEQYRKLSVYKTSKKDSLYSCVPFSEKRSLFIHIPKCAGVSINKTLFGNLGCGHLTANDYEIIFNPFEFKRLYKFTVVRNPYDRLASSFFFLRNGGFNEQDKQWADRYLIPYTNFEEFILKGLRLPNISSHHHFLPQTYYILNYRKQLAVDFVARFETLEKDFQVICKRLGRSDELLHLNKYSRPVKSFKTLYSIETRGIVEACYADDFRYLNYQFNED